MPNQTEDHLLTERDAACMLGVKRSTLEMWRHLHPCPTGEYAPQDEHTAPPFIVTASGEVLYPSGQLRAWIRNLPTSTLGIPSLPATNPAVLH
jgi:hypothetical protein